MGCYFWAPNAECLLSLSLLLSIMRKERVCMVPFGLKNNTPWKFESLQKLYCSLLLMRFDKSKLGPNRNNFFQYYWLFYNTQILWAVTILQRHSTMAWLKSSLKLTLRFWVRLLTFCCNLKNFFWRCAICLPHSKNECILVESSYTYIKYANHLS